MPCMKYKKAGRIARFMHTAHTIITLDGTMHKVLQNTNAGGSRTAWMGNGPGGLQTVGGAIVLACI